MSKKFNLENKMVPKPEDVMFMPSTTTPPIPEIVTEPVQEEKKEEVKNPTNSSQAGLKSGETRTTFIADQDLINKLYNIAYWKRLRIKEAVEEMLELYIEMNLEDANRERPIKKSKK